MNMFLFSLDQSKKPAAWPVKNGHTAASLKPKECRDKKERTTTPGRGVHNAIDNSVLLTFTVFSFLSLQGHVRYRHIYVHTIPYVLVQKIEILGIQPVKCLCV